MSSAIEIQNSSDGAVVGPTWAQRIESGGGSGERWIEVDNALRGIARRRAALDADEARWLREAQALKIWRQLGMTNAQDYMERVLGYGPKAAQDRLRVAEALGELPILAEALSQGELSFSAVRELSRVATRDTDAAWTSAAKGKNLRQIETLVTGRRSGDLPDDPPDPDVRTHVVRFELSPETFAAMRQARSILDADHRTNLTDDDFITVLANMVLEGAADYPTSAADERDDDSAAALRTDDESVDARSHFDEEVLIELHDTRDLAGSNEPTRSSDAVGTQRRAAPALPMTRAKHQVAVTICARCKQGWQLGAGAMIAIGPAAVARAECDAQHIGSLDVEMPQRAYQDISPAVARFVWRRDEARCQTPGCRSARGLEIHHVVPRGRGGGHEPSNLRLYCSSCHHAQHDDRLVVTAGGERIDARTAELARAASAPVEPASISVSAPTETRHSKPPMRPMIDTAVMRAQAKDALVGLGWKPAISRAAIDAAMTERDDLSLEALIREALKRCPKC